MLNGISFARRTLQKSLTCNYLSLSKTISSDPAVAREENAGKKASDHQTICDVHFNEMITKGTVELRPDSSGNQRKRNSNRYQKAHQAECLKEVTPPT